MPSWVEEEEEEEEEGRERERKNVWDICVFEFQCEEGEALHSAGALQWPQAFGVQRLRFSRHRHRLWPQFLIVLRQFRRLVAASRLPPRGKHRVPCQIRLPWYFPFAWSLSDFFEWIGFSCFVCSFWLSGKHVCTGNFFAFQWLFLVHHRCTFQLLENSSLSMIEYNDVFFLWPIYSSSF